MYLPVFSISSFFNLSGASMYNLYEEEEEENPPPISQVC